MTVIHVPLLLIAFLVGFHLGKVYVIKGLSLKVKQLYEDGDYPEAKLFEAILSKSEKE